MKPADVLKYAQHNGARMIDCKFIDFLGTWQHITYPIERLEDGLEEGFGFDGSSIRGWAAINNSDMLMIPDPATAILDPFLKTPTLSLLCNAVDPITRESYERCPRSLARRAEAYLKSTGIADTAYFGPEAEFFIFDSVRFDNTSNAAFYHVDSIEGRWNSGREEPGGNLGHKPNYKGGYFPVSPVDTFTDLRTDMVLTMQKVGIEVETHHHEVATAGQCEIDMRFDSLRKMADKVMMYKYVLRNVATRHGKTVAFMPKPLFGDNGTSRFRNDNHTVWYSSCQAETVRKTISNWHKTCPTAMTGCAQCKPERYRSFRNSYVWMDYLSQEEIRCRCEACTM